MSISRQQALQDVLERTPRIVERPDNKISNYYGENVFNLVPLSRLAELKDLEEISLQVLREKGFVSSKSRRVKILGGATIDRKIVVEAHAVSASAKAAIEEAGGEVRIIS